MISCHKCGYVFYLSCFDNENINKDYAKCPECGLDIYAKEVKMKNFLYCEALEGGMDSFEFSHNKKYYKHSLECLSGWLSKDCLESDLALVDWMNKAQVGEYYEHRLGTVIRLKGGE